MPTWSNLGEAERDRAKVAIAFLRGRLSSPAVLDWALRLEPGQLAERMAVLDLLNGNAMEPIVEPYATAWRLLEESWSVRTVEKHPFSIVRDIKARVAAGELSGALMTAIAELVAPYLEIKAPQERPWQPRKETSRPTSIHNLLSANLTSICPMRDLGSWSIDIGITKISDPSFLNVLASTLMSVVDRGLYSVRSIYGDDEERRGNPGRVFRVYFVRSDDEPNNGRETGATRAAPDAFNRGIAPAVKLLNAVVTRMASLDSRTGAAFAAPWRNSGSSIYRRLWAAAACDQELACSGDVGEVLMAAADVEFWNVRRYPEIAELRAIRFSDLDVHVQEAILQRLREGPPRALWPTTDGEPEVEAARRFWVARELRRIQIAGGVIPKEDGRWILEVMHEFPELEMMTADYGYSDPRVRPTWRESPRGAGRLDESEGETRLRLLTDALSNEGNSGGDIGYATARDWIGEPQNALMVLSDLESVHSEADRFALVWDNFCSFHSLHSLQSAHKEQRNAAAEAQRMLRLLCGLSKSTLQRALEGVSNWLASWSVHVVRHEQGYKAWFLTWPIAVESTNAAEVGKEDVRSESPVSREVPEDMRMRNTPTGKLVRIFLDALRARDDVRGLLGDDRQVEKMRDCVMGAPGYSRVIARALLTRELATCREAYPDWSKRNLLEPLLLDSDEAIVHWRAIASNWIGPETLEIIGDEIMKKVLDDRLDEGSRDDLVYCLVHEGLNAFGEGREPAVDLAGLSQMLRVADDQVRVDAAKAIMMHLLYRFEPKKGAAAAGKLFRATVKPFLRSVWPQERSLATPGISRQMVQIAPLAGDAFVEAVAEIERFLDPFASDSMLAYGFYDGDMADEMRTPQMSVTIDDDATAGALLRLLDRTIGDTTDAVYPEDLGVALERIQSVAPRLVAEPAFRRLSAILRH